MRTSTQVFDGGDFVEVPTGPLCMHSTACGDAETATQRPWEPTLAASGPGGAHRPTSRFRYTYEMYSNRVKKIWQYCQFSYHLIIPPNRSTGKCRQEKSVAIAAHGNALSTWHALHGRHSGYAAQWNRCEVCCAVGTESPAQFQETFALGAGPFELLTT